jgi:eukaryotic-like serine/threonine-protein kinase
LPEAAAILEEARRRKLDGPLLANYYQLAFLQNDEAEMERLFVAAQGSGNEDGLLAIQSDTEAFHGRLKKARDLSSSAIISALHADAKDTAAQWQVSEALREAELGNSQLAKAKARAAVEMAPTPEVQVAAAMAMARSGGVAPAEALADSLSKNYPVHTLIHNYWLPSIRAAIALQRHQSQDAITYLRSAAAFEFGGGRPPFFFQATMYPAYLRGEAFLAQHQWSEAAAEFEKILAHRGLVGNFPLGALAFLQLGRARAGKEDLAGAQKSYEEFLKLWRDADPTIRIVPEARDELAKLK